MLMFLAALGDSGDWNRFSEFYHHYKKLAFWVARRILNDEYLIEDAVQEAFTRIAARFSKLNEQDLFRDKTKNFVVIVVEHAAIDIYRKQKKVRDKECYLEQFEKTTYARESDSPEQNRVFDAMRALPKRYGEVLILHYVYGFKSREIAKLLGMKDATVRTNMRRGRELLESLMGNMVDEKGSGKEKKLNGKGSGKEKKLNGKGSGKEKKLNGKR